MFKLYSYYRSSAAYRARIALNLKNVAYEIIPVHLLKNGGEQFSADYTQKNPQQLVPALEVNGKIISQSGAILEYLEETLPTPALLPQDVIQRAEVRAFALYICCDIHPLNNRRIWEYLVEDLHLSEASKMQWYNHWIITGFTALERTLQKTAGEYCFGNTVTLADVCLIPQTFNAKRFNFSLDKYPTISRVYDNCLKLPAFIKASPEKQPDFE
jgi:maleylacetoacetate isomerase